MGKAGNKSRKARTVKQILMDKLQDSEDQQAIAAAREEELAGYQSNLERLLGPKGPPNMDPVLDMLGRKRPIADAIPPSIKAQPVISLPAPLKNDRRVTLMRDHTLVYPDLYLEVFIAGDKYEEAAFAPMFARSRCQRAKSVLEADLVVFTGGEDVDPALYGEEAHSTTRFNTARDQEEINLYLMCRDEGIPMLGVCRGAQFLHVMQGGKLFQDVDGHYGNHPMFDIRTGETIQQVSSVHHQMVIQNVANGMEIIGTSNKANTRWRNPKDSVVGNGADVEAYFYRDVCVFGVQGHPEYAGYNHFTKWTLDMLNELIIMNPDIAWINKNRRIKPELMAERDSIANSVPFVDSIEVTAVEVN